MIHSMTAFARCDAHHEQFTFVWEIRSVNQRYLDLHFRLPEQFRFLENDIRNLCRNYLQRGKVELGLRFHQADAEQKLTLNESLVSQLAILLNELKQTTANAAPISLTDLIKHPGVLQQEEVDFNSFKAPILTLLEKALGELCAAREREGQAMATAIHERLNGIAEQVSIVETALPAILQAQQEKLKNRVQEVTENIDQDRLEQELVVLANRMDVAEEIDRLKAHQEEVKRILAEGGAIGRRLDFLMQEFNREANTLGSKSIDTATTNAAVELKVLIEQMREQVQNLE